MSDEVPRQHPRVPIHSPAVLSRVRDSDIARKYLRIHTLSPAHPPQLIGNRNGYTKEILWLLWIRLPPCWASISAIGSAPPMWHTTDPLLYPPQGQSFCATSMACSCLWGNLLGPLVTALKRALHTRLQRHPRPVSRIEADPWPVPRYPNSRPRSISLPDPPLTAAQWQGFVLRWVSRASEGPQTWPLALRCCGVSCDRAVGEQ